MSKVHGLSELDRNIIDLFDVGTWHVDRQVQVQRLDVLVDVAAVVGLRHRKLAVTDIVCETVKSCGNIRMDLQVDPSSDIFLLVNLAQDELLSKVLVVDHVLCFAADELSVPDYAFHLHFIEFRKERDILTTALPPRSF